MFSHLSDLKKAALFFGLVMVLSLALVFFLSRAAPQAERVILLNMLTPLLATLIMVFVLTREGLGGKAAS